MQHHRFLRWSLIVFGFALLPACSSYAPPAALVGMSREALVARMGQPETERKVDAGSRLEFARGPLGKQTWFVYFDATGRANRDFYVYVGGMRNQASYPSAPVGLVLVTRASGIHAFYKPNAGDSTVPWQRL